MLELLIAACIVGTLSLVAAPLYSQNVVPAIMCEGIAGAGVIRTEMRIYLSQHGSYAGASFSAASNNICIGAADLEGKYFAQSDYALTGVTGSQYTIMVSSPSKATRKDMPTYSMDQDGREHGTFYSGM
jgi:Tfp pilus assembly protein PilE